MAQKTYLIGLYFAMKTLHKYITRWQQKLEANMDAPTYTCLVAVLNAINECLPLILPPPPQ